MTHVSDRLSAYLDGELPETERRAVAAHLETCPGCRSKLDEVRAICRTLSALPRQPLPSGFMHRLNARRRAQETPAAFFPDFSPRLRTAAFALSGVAVAFVAVEGLRERARPASFVSAPSPFGAVAPAKSPAGSLEKKSSGMRRRESLKAKAGVAASDGEARANNAGKLDSLVGVLAVRGDAGTPSPSGGGAGGLKQTRNAPAPVRKAEERGRAPGAPYGEPMPSSKPPFDNDSQQAFLADEKDRLGIKQIVPPQPGFKQLVGFGRPARRFKAVDESFPAAVAGATPGLLAAPDVSGAAVPPPSFTGGGLAEESRAAFAPGTPAQPDAGWSPPAEPDGTVVKSQAELSALWKGFEGTPPSIDFTRQMLVVILTGPPAGLTASIASIATIRGRIVVRYRLAVGTAKAGGTNSFPYPFQAIPRADLPVVFEEAQ